MTPDQQRHQRHWDLMTYPERLRFVCVLFDSAEPDDIVWITREPFSGWHKWDRMTYE
jgi:hypothetical protein